MVCYNVSALKGADSMIKRTKVKFADGTEKTQIRVIKSVRTGEDKKPIGMCLSDFPMFTNYGTPTAMTFGCGRFFDMEGGAHQFNEYIECDKLVEFTKIIALFLLNYKF